MPAAVLGGQHDILLLPAGPPAHIPAPPTAPPPPPVEHDLGDSDDSDAGGWCPLQYSSLATGALLAQLPPPLLLLPSSLLVCHGLVGQCLSACSLPLPMHFPTALSAGEDDEAIAARAEWEASERRRLEPPRLVLLRTQSNQ